MVELGSVLAGDTRGGKSTTTSPFADLTGIAAQDIAIADAVLGR